MPVSAACAGGSSRAAERFRYAIVDGMNVRDSRVHNYPPRWNAAPSQELLVIRRNHKSGEVSLDALRWCLIPYWCSDPKGGRKPINAHPGTRRFRAPARRRARPRDLMRPFPSDPMRMWPVSTRVNTPENAAAAIIEPIELASDAA
jgi:putative SOS response-associated peptidase YedK